MFAGRNDPDAKRFPLRLRQAERSGGHGNGLEAKIAVHAVDSQMTENGIGLDQQ